MLAHRTHHYTLKVPLVEMLACHAACMLCAAPHLVQPQHQRVGAQRQAQRHEQLVGDALVLLLLRA